MNARIHYVDGLRGIAIIFVVFFHAYSRWGSIEPFRQNEFFHAIFSYGWLGVQLFFAISGYVIYMSILRSDNIIMFASSRYLRLAPAMFIASILIYFTSFLIPERPLGTSNIIDFLPCLTFIDPGLLSKITGFDVRSLDGSFWSLYVEVKFYFLAAIAFFIMKDKKLNFLLLLDVAWLLLLGAKYLPFNNFVFTKFLEALNYVGVQYYGWFMTGVYAFRFDSNRTLGNLVVLILMSISAALTTSFGNVQITVAASLTAILFLCPLFVTSVRNILSSSLLLFFGFISYPLYLIHQNIVTGLAIKLHNLLPSLPPYIYPVPFIILVVLVAFILAKLEPSLKFAIERFVPIRFLGFKILKRK